MPSTAQTERDARAGKNLRAAPYDFRFGPQTWKEEDWPRLRALIEHTSAINNNSKGTPTHLVEFSTFILINLLMGCVECEYHTTVACVSESMGGPYFLGFLNQQTQAWKDRFIHSYTSIDGAFGGSSSALSTLISSTGPTLCSLSVFFHFFFLCTFLTTSRGAGCVVHDQASGATCSTTRRPSRPSPKRGPPSCGCCPWPRYPNATPSFSP